MVASPTRRGSSPTQDTRRSTRRSPGVGRYRPGFQPFKLVPDDFVPPRPWGPAAADELVRRSPVDSACVLVGPRSLDLGATLAGRAAA